MKIKIEQVGDDWQVRLKSEVQSFDLGMPLETYEEATWFAGQFEIMLEEYADEMWREGYEAGQAPPGVRGEPQ